MCWSRAIGRRSDSHPRNFDEVNKTTEKGLHIGHKHHASAYFVMTVIRYSTSSPLDNLT
jgi:hypothetical protein